MPSVSKCTWLSWFLGAGIAVREHVGVFVEVVVELYEPLSIGPTQNKLVVEIPTNHSENNQYTKRPISLPLIHTI